MSSIKVSVIVPVYNVEKYLKTCLESLLNQTLSDIEIICVNDGSKDNSETILNEYKDKNIKVFYQENKGVSAARNLGLKNAHGEFIMFLDGDDYYQTDTCQKAYEEISKTNSDIGVFGITELYEHTTKECNVNKHLKRIIEKQIPADLWKFQTYSVNKIYKKAFLDRFNITFPEGIKTAEDGIFSLTCLFNNPKFCFINKSLYIYRKNNKNSVTKSSLAIKSDCEAFEYFSKTEIFQKQNNQNQIKVVEKFCSGIWNYYKTQKRRENEETIDRFLGILEQNFDKNELYKLKKYRQLKIRNRNLFYFIRYFLKKS